MSAFNEDLLIYYQRELQALRALGSEFARAYPKVAARLELSEDGSPDPQVERLIESVAFLTARIQHTIDSDFPLIPGSLLNVLYPHLTAPTPSVSIARITPDPTQGTLTSGHLVPRGTRLFAETAEGATCRFRTSYDTTLWPITLGQPRFTSVDAFPFLTGSRAVGVLAVPIEASGALPLDLLPIDRLRLHLSGDILSAAPLYELIAGASGIVVIPDDAAFPTANLGEQSIELVGFAAHESVLPAPPQAHPGYRLIQEYFACPSKFMFLDLLGLRGSLRGRRSTLLFLLSEAPSRTVALDQRSLELGCTPVINLFSRTSEPVRLDHTKFEYRLSPDARFESTTEIHSVLRVSASADAREKASVIAPYFSVEHGAAAHEHSFYLTRRVASSRVHVPGTDMLISFVDLDFSPRMPADLTVFAHTLCTNRGLAEELPPGAVLQMENALPATGIALLRRPTPQQGPPLGGDTLWRLVSHLSLNMLSLGNEESCLAALKEILLLYGQSSQPGFRKQVEGLHSMSVERAVSRVGDQAWRGFVSGQAITLTFDERNYVGASAFLFGAVLRHFFALYASMNTFTQLTVRSLQRDEDWKRWPAVTGALDVL
jgi:type VI secretion system protein ImpG